MTAELIRIIVAIAGVIAVLAALFMWWMNRTPHIERDESGILPLFGGVERGVDATPDVGIMDGGTVRLQAPYVNPTASAVSTRPTGIPSRSVGGPLPARDIDHETGTAVTPKQQSSAPGNQSSDISRSPRPNIASPPTPRRGADIASSTVREFVTGGLSRPPKSMAAETDSAVISAAGVPGTMVEGQLLRFSIPAEGTLQFLPGRLEIASGMDSGREIRFVRVPGPHEMEVTFGRSEGELYRHIQLRDQTVSRTHAVMRLVDGVWTLMNHSRTNPVVHNGKVLEDGAEQELEDGDRIEMGEVLFTFRSR